MRKGFKYYIEYRGCKFPENSLYERQTGSSKVDAIVVWDKDGYYGTYFYNENGDKVERISFHTPPKKVGGGEYTNDYVERFEGYTKCIIR